jgi:hypothetical protein
MCLRENQHFHELDSHGSNAVVVRVEQLHDDLLHVDHEAPGRLHAVRDGLGLAQPFQRGPKKISVGNPTPDTTPFFIHIFFSYIFLIFFSYNLPTGTSSSV